MKSEKSPPPSRAGRPRSEEKRDAILDAAGALFLEHGLDRTSMDAVAQRAGVSKQTVYSHFAGKEDLLTACVGCKLELHELSGSLAHSCELPMREALQEMARRFLDLIYDAEVIAMYRVIIGSVGAHQQLARLFFDAGPSRATEAWRAVVSGYAASGELCVEETDAAVDMLLGMLMGGPHMQAILGVREIPDSAWRRAWARRCTDGFLAMFGAQAGAGRPRRDA